MQEGMMREANASGPVCGIAAGSRVMTLDGEIPVEFVAPGDRIVTRDGMRRVVAVGTTTYSGRAMHLAEGALGHDRPLVGLTLPAATRVHLRDWRAKAMFGASTADAPVAQLFDGQFVTEVQVTRLRVVTLAFDSPQVVYVEGLEIACDAALPGTGAMPPLRVAAGTGVPA
jgi:hypothetical protein